MLRLSLKTSVIIADKKNVGRPGRGVATAIVLLVLTLQSHVPGIAQTKDSKARAGTSRLKVDTVNGFQVVTLASGLDTPWDLSWGPDNWIWVTERKGSISRVNPENGSVSVAGTVDVIEISESGLMGLTFHPNFSSNPYVYVVYSYGTKREIKNRLVRLRFDGRALGEPEVLLDGIPGAPNHNGARLTVGPDGYLYVTTGDAQKASLAQKPGSLAGKVLRLTLEGQPAPGNPFRNAVYSLGHRNPQGIAFHPHSRALYITEHGPADNDEINRVQKGKNYGWPKVRGFCDGDVWGEKRYCRNGEMVEPLAAWTPTIAPSGLDFYDADLFSGWKGSLLFTTLKGSALFRLGLSQDGKRVLHEKKHFEDHFGRLRDVLVGPKGEVYLATSNRDGRAWPSSRDDRILRITPTSKR